MHQPGNPTRALALVASGRVRPASASPIKGHLQVSCAPCSNQGPEQVTAYLSVLVLILLGRLLALTKLLPDTTPEVLNRVVITLCLPAVMLVHVPQLELSAALAPLIWTPWVLLLISAALILLLSRALGLGRDATAVLLLLVPLGNTSFLGYPMTAALIGEAAVPYAVVYDQFGSFLMLCSYAMLVAAIYGAGPAPGPGQVLHRILTFPPFIALLLALGIGNDWIPSWGMELVDTFADMLLPLVMLAIGMSLRLRLVRRYRLPLAIGLSGKLLVLPAIASLLMLFARPATEIAQVVVLESAMPPMVTAAILLTSANLAAPLANALAAWGIVLSVVTVPLWHLLSLQLFGT